MLKLIFTNTDTNIDSLILEFAKILWIFLNPNELLKEHIKIDQWVERVYQQSLR